MDKSRSMAEVVVLVALLILVAACGSDGSSDVSSTDSSRPRTYVGTVATTSAFVAVVVDGSNALAYVCDGVPADPIGTAPTVQAWFAGPSDGRQLDLQGKSGRLEARLSDEGMTGTLTLPDGSALTLRADAASGDAGLYRAETSGPDGAAVAGWILAGDGAQRGALQLSTTGGLTTSGTTLLRASQPTFTFEGLATSRISKVGITPIPIP